MTRYTFLIAMSLTLSLLSPGTAHAQSGAKEDSIGEDAVDAVTQPLSDLNLRSKEIPLILTLAQEEPYNLTEVAGCDAVRTEIARLDAVLGPDANEPAERRGLVNRGLQVGGDVLGGMIPFRSIVRRLSGARAERKRWEAAIFAGVARRSFLKGYLAGQACETPEEASVETARDVLGMEASNP
ncbi:hypothetical protein [Erythrobacter longus]|uniref:hypothetical protein n=1 Tax=Erythrobacter longus TaxID=1044 RepID=UPI001268E0C0|nr:hypothetical protein [Erythrobacter longus]